MAKFGNINSRSSFARGASSQDLFAYTSDFSQQSLSVELRENLSRLARLVANAVEAYSAVIFLANKQRKEIVIGGYHTLSRDFVSSARIGYGCGLIGWCAENGVNITVCPFDADPSTLMYYRGERALKSFTAMPIVDESGQVLGVIACDSKKSYAFPKITEKILVDFCGQCAAVINLVQNLEKARKEKLPPIAPLTAWMEQLQSSEDEGELLLCATYLPEEIVERDALVVITTSESGIGAGRFYSKSELDRLGHRLLDMVYKHKKVICAERSVHVLPSDDFQNRSFLSVAFKVLEHEAGSLNVLGKVGQTFSTYDIETLERIAHIIGGRLEHLRLRDRFSNMDEFLGILSPKLFAIKGNALLNEGRGHKAEFSLMRISLDNFYELEQAFGFVDLSKYLKQLIRLIEQVKGSSSIACRLDNFAMLLLVDRSEAKRLETRLRSLVKKICRVTISDNFLYPGLDVGDMITSSLNVSVAEFPYDGVNIESLAEKTLATITAYMSNNGLEEAVNV